MLNLGHVKFMWMLPLWEKGMPIGWPSCGWAFPESRLTVPLLVYLLEIKAELRPELNSGVT